MFGKLDKFVFTGEPVPTEASVPRATPTAPATAAAASTQPVFNAGSSDQNKVDRFKSVIFDAIEKSLSGSLPFDYYKYRQAVKANEGSIPDERVRYTSAFQMAKILKITKDQLLSSANKSLEVIASEEQAFQDTVKDQQSSIDNLSKQAETYNAQIAQTQTTLDQLKKSLAEITAQRDQEGAKLSAALGNYHAATLAVSSDIKADITKITTYLEQ